MEKLTILFPYSSGPNISSFYSMFLKSILVELKKKFDTKIIWLVYQPEKKPISNNNNDIKLVYLQDYVDALDVLKREKPDIIFSFPWPDFITYAFQLGAKSLDIPTFSILFSHSYQKRGYIKTLRTHTSRFFEKSIPTDTTDEPQQFMRRGRFFLKKYDFLKKTQQNLGLNTFRVIKDFLTLTKLILFETKGIIDKRFATNIHFAVGEKIIQQYVEKGFDPSSIIPTGNPIYDSFLKRSFEQSPPINKKKIRVLFAPSTLYESGFWTKQERDFTVTKIVDVLINSNEVELTVKIHPSTARLSEYVELIHPIDNSINIVQNGDIRDFLSNTDIYISSETSTGEFFAVIDRIPIVICRFFKDSDENILVKAKVAELCTDPNYLIKIIRHLFSQKIPEQYRLAFIKNYLYKDDGCASERISNEISKLLIKND